MAITTLSGVISGLQQPSTFVKSAMTVATSKHYSSWGLAGQPAAGAYDTTLNGVTLTAPVTGQLVFNNPPSGNAYLGRLQATLRDNLGTGGTLILCDRLWHNGGYTITSTSAQNSTTPTWPARDIAGSTNGDGVFLGLEVSAATGAGTPTITCAYTNQAGTGSRSATNIVATVASSAARTFYPIGLQAGDTGVRSLQSVTLSATWTSGTMNMVAYRPIAWFSPKATTLNEPDILTAAEEMARVYSGTVPFFIWHNNTNANSTSIQLQGNVQWTFG